MSLLNGIFRKSINGVKAMQKQVLQAEIRSEFGKNASGRLRTRGYVPAIVYSHGKTESIMVTQKDLFKIFRGHLSESVLLDLTIKGKSDNDQHQVFIKDYQINPITDEITHLDFFKVTAGERIQTKVPVEVEGMPKGVRKGGMMEFMERELEIECLPSDIPEKILIDVTKLEIGDSIHISELPSSGSLKYLGDPTRVVVTVLAPTKVAEPEEAVAGEAVVEKEAAKKEE